MRDVSSSRVHQPMRLPAVLLFLSCLTLYACATPGKKAFESAPLVRPGAKIQVGRVSVAPEQSYDVEVETLLQAALKKAIRERGIEWSGDPSEDYFILNTEISEYETGNAFKRWVLPFWGSTVLRVRGQLMDARDGSVAGEIDHERGVYAGGAYTIGAWKTVFRTVANDIAQELENRIEGKGFVIRLASWSRREIEIPETDTPQTFRVGPVLDRRADRSRIGERHAAFGVSMGDIYFSRSVTDYLSETIGDELRGAGHKVDGSSEGRQVSVEVIKFWVRTDTTVLYWDVIGDIEIKLSVDPLGQNEEKIVKSYSCSNKERTYAYPSKTLVTKVIDGCLVELMDSLRSSSIWNGR